MVRREVWPRPPLPLPYWLLPRTMSPQIPSLLGAQETPSQTYLPSPLAYGWFCKKPPKSMGGKFGKVQLNLRRYWRYQLSLGCSGSALQKDLGPAAVLATARSRSRGREQGGQIGISAESPLMRGI